MVDKTEPTPAPVSIPEGLKTRSRHDVIGAGIIKTKDINAPFFVQSFILSSIKDANHASGRKPIWILNAVTPDGEAFQFRLGCNEGRDNQFHLMQQECEQGFAMGPFRLVQIDTGNPLNPMWDLEDVPTG